MCERVHTRRHFFFAQSKVIAFKSILDESKSLLASESNISEATRTLPARAHPAARSANVWILSLVSSVFLRSVNVYVAVFISCLSYRALPCVVLQYLTVAFCVVSLSTSYTLYLCRYK